MEADLLQFLVFARDLEIQRDLAARCEPRFRVRHLVMEVQAIYRSCGICRAVDSSHTHRPRWAIVSDY